jgi:transcriptional regulator with XRE-family HTH domain
MLSHWPSNTNDDGNEEKEKSVITFDDIWRKLSDKRYREHYALSLLKRSVAFQIKTLRKKHCGSQAELAEAAGITQGVVSRAEDPDYGNLTFNTVGRIANGFDMAFIGKFVPWSELAKFSQNLSEDAFANLPTFEEENEELSSLGHLGRAENAPPDVDVLFRKPPQSVTDQDEPPKSKGGALSSKPEGAAAAAAAS